MAVVVFVVGVVVDSVLPPQAVNMNIVAIDTNSINRKNDAFINLYPYMRLNTYSMK